MGLYRGMMEALIREKARKPYSGRACTLGRQTMDTTPEETIAVFHALDVPPETETKLEVDRTTITAIRDPARQTIRDIDFFRMLGLKEVHAIDINKAEGADIILDLNQPIPRRFERSCGLLVDGSTLDNIFDTSTGLRNVARMLAPGGRCFLCNMGNTSVGYPGIPYTMFNPFWFFDYFVWNEFDYCQVYVALVHESDPVPPIYAISYEHAARRSSSGFIHPIVSERAIALTVYAEKGARSTWQETPTQHAYRSEADWARYIAIVEKYHAQQRSYLQRGKAGAIPPEIPVGYKRVWPDGSDRYTALAADP